MHTKHLALTALLSGFFLASCAPKESPPAAEPAAESTGSRAQLMAEKAATAETAPAEAPAADAPAVTPTEVPAPPVVAPAAEPEWISLFNGENLEGWTQHGAAKWEVVDGVMTGKSEGGQGHIYAAPVLTDLEVKGKFRITVTAEGKNANSGLYFRCNPPEDNVDDYPNGYEAQICNSQEAHTGWLWKPGKGVGKASKLLTKDGEWFDMRVRAVGPHIEIWVNEELVMTYDDEEYKEGLFAVQCHNDGMVAEAKDLYYRDLSK